MKLRHLLACTALATAAAGAATVNAGGGHDDMGEITVGETIYFSFDCPTDGNDFNLLLEGNSVDSDGGVGVDEDYLIGYPYDTTGLALGAYTVELFCDEGGDEFTYAFTLVAADPCAPPDSIVTPKGPGRAPHGAPIDCSDSGLPDAGSNSNTVLLFGSLAIVAGTGLLIARRRSMA